MSLRKQKIQTIIEGDYIPLEINGPCRRHFLGFLRQSGREAILVITPRFLASKTSSGRSLGMDPDFTDAQIQIPDELSGVWRNILTDKDMEFESTLSIKDLLGEFPIGVFVYN